jgi:polyisoprenoid-binding protein YceI
MARTTLFALGVSMAAAAFVFVPGDAGAQLKSAGASVSFTAVGPAGMKINGTTSELAVKDDAQKITVTVPLANLKTGIDLRDKHMREKYLQVAQFPNAELEVSRASLNLPADGSNAAGSGQGTMKIHGKSKPVTFKYTAKRAGTTYEVSGNVQVNVKDYGIEIPSYMGVTVKPDVDVAVKFTAKDQ